MITKVLNSQIQVSQYILDKHTEDISQEESLRSPETGGSSLNWLAGHILASRNAMLKLLEGEPNLTDEESEPYRRGTRPDGDAAFLPLATLRDRLAESAGRLAKGFENLDQTKLDEPAPFSPLDRPDETYGSLLGFLTFHEAYHSGQTGVIRRFLGKDAVIK